MFGQSDPFSSGATPMSASSGGLMASGGSGFGGMTNGSGTNGAHARGPSNGAEDFSDFQGSGTPSGGGGGGEAVGSSTSAAAAAAAAAKGASGVTNPKWRDVSSLVDLGGLSSNTDKKVLTIIRRVLQKCFCSS